MADTRPDFDARVEQLKPRRVVWKHMDPEEDDEYRQVYAADEVDPIVRDLLAQLDQHTQERNEPFTGDILDALHVLCTHHGIANRTQTEFMTDLVSFMAKTLRGQQSSELTALHAAQQAVEGRLQDALKPFIEACIRSIKGQPGRHDGCTAKGKFTLGDCRRLLGAVLPAPPVVQAAEKLGEE